MCTSSQYCCVLLMAPSVVCRHENQRTEESFSFHSSAFLLNKPDYNPWQRPLEPIDAVLVDISVDTSFGVIFCIFPNSFELLYKRVRKTTRLESAGSCCCADHLQAYFLWSIIVISTTNKDKDTLEVSDTTEKNRWYMLAGEDSSVLS